MHEATTSLACVQQARGLGKDQGWETCVSHPHALHAGAKWLPHEATMTGEMREPCSRTRRNTGEYLFTLPQIGNKSRQLKKGHVTLPQAAVETEHMAPAQASSVVACRTHEQTTGHLVPRIATPTSPHKGCTRSREGSHMAPSHTPCLHESSAGAYYMREPAGSRMKQQHMPKFRACSDGNTCGRLAPA